MAEWVHDLGGAGGHGRVEIESEEPVFHADWERRMFGMAAGVMAQGHVNGSEFRHAIERMDPEWYLGSSYYEHWLAAISTLLVEKNVITREELEQRGAPGFPLSRRGATPDPPPPAGDGEPFAAGQRVRVRDLDPAGHTRCPAYIRGRIGTIVRADGVHPVPDVEAHREDPPAEPTYSVRFAATELWGDDADGTASICVDLWHRYLEAAR